MRSGIVRFELFQFQIQIILIVDLQLWIEIYERKKYEHEKNLSVISLGSSVWDRMSPTPTSSQRMLRGLRFTIVSMLPTASFLLWKTCLVSRKPRSKVFIRSRVRHISFVLTIISGWRTCMGNHTMQQRQRPIFVCR